MERGESGGSEDVGGSGYGSDGSLPEAALMVYAKLWSVILGFGVVWNWREYP